MFIIYGHVRDRDRSRLVSAARWQHDNLMDYEVPWELKRVPLDWWEDKSPNFALKVKQLCWNLGYFNID